MEQTKGPLLEFEHPNYYEPISLGTILEEIQFEIDRLKDELHELKHNKE